MKTKNIKVLALVLVLILSILGGCSQQQENNSVASSNNPPASGTQPAPSASNESQAKTIVRIGGIKGPSSLGMLQIMENNNNKKAKNIYEFTVAGSPQDIQAKIINGELDIAAVPSNLAAALYNKTDKKLSVIAVSTLGVLYLLTNGEDISSVQDLEGKTVYATGQGSVPEYVLEHILAKNNVKAEIEYKGEHAELASLMSAGEVNIAMLPQPFVTTVMSKNQDIKVALDLNDEWRKATGTELAMTCIVVRNTFLEKCKPAVDKFLDEYKESTEFVNNNVNEAAALSGKFDIIPEAVAKTAIPKCGIVFFEGDELKPSVSPLLEVLLAANPQSVGGSLPDDAFYYKR